MTTKYRDEAPQYQEAWDWDIIVYPDCTLRVLCFTHGCLYTYGHQNCDCRERSRMSSPIVDDFGGALREGAYYEAVTGRAKFLMDSKDGSEIRVLSGKTYRLVGPHSPHKHKEYGCASIWRYYEEYEQRIKRKEKLAKSWIARLIYWWKYG